MNIEFACLVFFSWGTVNSLIELLETSEAIIESLDDRAYIKLVRAISAISDILILDNLSYVKARQFINTVKVSDKVKYLISLRFHFKHKMKFIYENISEDNLKLKDILEAKMHYLMNTYMQDATDLKTLNRIKFIYGKTKSFNHKHISWSFNSQYFKHTHIPLPIAKQIMEENILYPRLLTSVAESVCRSAASKKRIHVGDVAKKERWFN
jgi:hypothetical protein